MTDLSAILAIVNLVVIIAGIIAGRVVLKTTIAKSENEIKERVMNDLSKENEVLRNRLQRVETENKQQDRIMRLIISTLKKLYDIELDVDEDTITLRSANGHVSRVSMDV